MKLTKRLTALLLAVSMMFVLSACQQEKAPSAAGSGSASSTSPAASSSAAQTLDYPNDVVTMIVGFQAGAGSDLMARALASYIDLDGQTMVVNNITGSGGIIGMMECYNAPGDGYTMCVLLPESITANILNGVVAEDVFDHLIPVASPVYDPFTICVRADSPIQSIEDLIKATQENPDMTLCGSTGGVTKLSAVDFLETTGAKAKYVPYDDGNTARTALLGGNADMLIATLCETKTYHESGDFRILAVLAEERASFLPDIPTATEQGYEVLAGQTRGFAVSPDTPDEIVRYLEEKIHEVYNNSEFVEYFQNTLGYNMKWTGHDEYTELARGLKDKFTKLTELAKNY